MVVARLAVFGVLILLAVGVLRRVVNDIMDALEGDPVSAALAGVTTVAVGLWVIFKVVALLSDEGGD